MSKGEYRDLIAWKKAFDLALAIYRATSKFPIEERYGITSQLRRAGVSVPSNIAEGQGRNSRGEFLHHLSVAIGSLKEAETQILLSDGLGYLSKPQVDTLMSLAKEVGRLMGGLIRSLRQRSLTTSH